MKPIFVKLLILTLLSIFAAGLSGCGASQRCQLPDFPKAPSLAKEPPECPAGALCLGPEETRALGIWLRSVDRWRSIAEGCR